MVKCDDELVSPQFTARIVGGFGEEGRTWLAHLPAILRQAEQRWSLTVHDSFRPLSYNYVAPATRQDGTAVVLKAGVPNAELGTEMAALQIFDGRGAVRLIDTDAEAGLLLLERLKPGSTLVHLAHDEHATVAAIGVMRQLWQPVHTIGPFPTVYDWAQGLKRLRTHFDGGTGPFPPRLVDAAESLFQELIPSMGQAVLLHGDLHHHNILSAQRQPWLAIDPKGVIGEREYEVGALLRNPITELLTYPNLEATMRRRVDLIVDHLGFDRQRVTGWAAAQAVLAGWWSIEDQADRWQPWLRCAELLLHLHEQS
jgi:streptomycin 6-kinase